MRTTTTVLAVTATWIGLWGDLSAANVIAGFLLGVVLAVRFRPVPDAAGRFHPIAGLRLLGHFAVVLTTSTIRVAGLVLAFGRPAPPSGVVEVPVRSQSRLVQVLTANFLTLTPGTVALDIVDGRMRVHLMDARDPDGAVRDIERIEQMTMAAFGRRPSDAEVAVP